MRRRLGEDRAQRGDVYAIGLDDPDAQADRDFVLDVLPDHPHVAVFNGAGHAGKRQTVAVGEISSP